MTDQTLSGSDELRRATRLLWYRAVIAVLLLGVAIYFYFQPLPPLQRAVMLAVAFAFLLFSFLQWLMLKSPLSLSKQLGFHFLTDLVLVSGLVFATGGVESPFGFVYALIIMAAGTQATVMLILAISVAASACYLCATYANFWLLERHVLSPDMLAILLQVSAFLLVGGVMAAIAARQERLQKDRRQAIRKHDNLQQLHGKILDTMQEGVLVLDLEFLVQESNKAARQMLADGKSLQDRALSEFIEIPAMLKRYFEQPQRISCQCEYQAGGQTYMLSAVRLKRGDDFSSWLLSIVDISDLRKLETELAEQDKLAALGRMAAMLAHEIRNPLQTIGQAVELIPKGTEPHEQEVRGIVLEETRRLNRLLSDMLDYTRPLKSKPEDSNMSDLIEGAVRQTDMDEAFAIHWQCDLSVLKLDADHFRLLLDNLLRNAIKVSSEPGSIHVLLQPVGKKGWRLEVSDSGTGIPDDIRQHLFQPFVASQPGGWGLGLATVWQVCQANGWRIHFDSSAKGTCFTIEGMNSVISASRQKQAGEKV